MPPKPALCMNGTSGETLTEARGKIRPSDSPRIGLSGRRLNHPINGRVSMKLRVEWVNRRTAASSENPNPCDTASFPSHRRNSGRWMRRPQPFLKTGTTMSKPYRLRAVSSINRAYSSDPLERVEAFSGTNPDHTRWRLSQAAVVAAIEAGTDEFFVNASDGVVRLIVVTQGGQKYVQSEREKTHPDDLLALFVT